MALASLLFYILTAFVSCAVCVDLRLDEPEERECYGTTVGFGYSGSLDFHYQQLRKRYAGCTYIHGNLEITNILDPNIKYDLSFLKTIRYVSGYVLLGLISEVEQINLDSLEVIRANNTYRIMGDDYSLVVAITSRFDEQNSGLKTLLLPRLKVQNQINLVKDTENGNNVDQTWGTATQSGEISSGKVLFTRNPSLGYVNTINWEPIVRGRPNSVHFHDNAFDETVSENESLIKCPEGGKWGDDILLCQQAMPKFICHEKCQGRCFGTEEQECCHNSCAVGCSGGSDKQCYVCKDYLYEAHCVGFCPAKSYPKLQNCVKY